jgi:dTDP-4-amino-4,6-dideoxygalactose transaminase
LVVIEDAAHALPARYKGRRIGSGNNPVSFSFHATKNLTTAEGGMLTGSVQFLERARVFSLHGMSRDAWKRYAKGGTWVYDVVAPGFKHNMTDIQAGLGLAQLAKLESLQARRRRVVSAYQTEFAEFMDALELPVERSDVEHAWHLYPLRLRADALRIDRNAFIEELTHRNIGSSVHFIPIHLHSFYADKYGYGENDFPTATSNYRRLLSLPLSAKMTDQDTADVIDAVCDIVISYRR